MFRHSNHLEPHTAIIATAHLSTCSCHHEDELDDGTGHRSEQLRKRDEAPLMCHHRRSDEELHGETDHHHVCVSGKFVVIFL